MTEAEWLTCNDPAAMLDDLRARGLLSDRKARLFAVAVCRHLGPLLADERSRTAVEVAERYADGQATPGALWAAGEAAVNATRALTDARDAEWPAEPPGDTVLAGEAAEMSAVSLSGGRVWGADGGYAAWEAAVEAAAVTGGAVAREQVQRYQAAVLRCIFGTPLCPAALDGDHPMSGGTVVLLAGAAYEEWVMPGGTLDPTRLAVLADALEAAGCRTADLLAHLRGPGPHVRGCWALDAVLWPHTGCGYGRRPA